MQPASGGSSITEASGSPPADASHGARTAEELRRTRSSPLVRKIAAEHNIDITRLEGTGASGRVTKNDILSYIESGASMSPQQAAQSEQQFAPSTSPTAEAAATSAPSAPTVQPAEGDRVEPMTLMRKKIAEHMTMSQRTSAHVATVYEIDMTRVHRLRESKKAEFYQRVGTKLSYMPFIFQAITQAIRKFPVFNSQVSGDQIIYKRDINLGMAVALDWGLIVPVIKRADDLSVAGLARSPTTSPSARAPSSLSPTRSRAGRSPSPTPASSADSSARPSSTSRRSPYSASAP